MAWIVGVCVLVAAAVGLWSARRVAGPLGARALGGVLFLGGAAVVFTEYQYYWLSEPAPFLLAAVVTAVLGVVAVLSGGRGSFTLGGLSGACGLLAVACVAAESVSLPGIGSYERDQLTVAAVSLAVLAVSAGLGAIGPGSVRLTAAALAVAGVVGTVAAAYRAFPSYGKAGDKATTVAIAVVGSVALMLLGGSLVLRWQARARVPGEPVPGQSTPGQLMPGQLMPEQPMPEQPMPEQRVPELDVRVPAPALPVPGSVAPAPYSPYGPATVGAASTGLVQATQRGRLELIATIVGIVGGLIAILKEIVSLLQSLGG